MADEVTSVPQTRLDFGKLQFGCNHYKRRCKIRAPCCNRVFTCRHCHNEAMSSLSNPKEHHELVRRDVTQVICAVCDTEQPVAKVCSSCGVNMGGYFCEVCKFYDDEIEKQQFHCDECGICRVGGRENFFHCQNVLREPLAPYALDIMKGLLKSSRTVTVISDILPPFFSLATSRKLWSCYSMDLRDNHECVQDAMKNFCPICYEYLFDSIKGTQVMRCGHTIHMDCFSDMLEKKQYRCPICSKSAADMSRTWELLDEEIGAVPMPSEYQYEVLILCNDCNGTSRVKFHIFGHKCSQCNSYNTRVMQKLDTQSQQPQSSDTQQIPPVPLPSDVRQQPSSSGIQQDPPSETQQDPPSADS